MDVKLLVALVIAVVPLAASIRWLARTRDLRISLFRPYRGDPWPIGVQEDDDVRFDWSPPTPAPPRLELALGAAVAAAGVAAGGGAGSAAAGATLEELTDGGVEVERPRHVELRGARR